MKPELKRKLEIALCNYLPYGLKAYHKNKEEGVDIAIVGCIQDLIRMHNGKYPQEVTFDKFQEYNYKLILHPLSDIAKEIGIKVSRIEDSSGNRKYDAIQEDPDYQPTLNFVPIKAINEINSRWSIENGIFIERISHPLVVTHSEPIGSLPYWLCQKLFEWHFDVHDLIKEGLAIDINTLTTKHK